MSGFAPGGPAWLLAICVSRVGAYMVYIAYAATLPVSCSTSLGIAGVGAVVSVVLLHRTPAAAALHGPTVRRAAASAGAR